MSGMDQYEAAVCKFYASLDINSSPLISWDIYGQYFNMVCRYFEDIVCLQKLANKNQWAYRSQFDAELFEKSNVIVVTDIKLTIVLASNNIISMNGYRPSEVIGKHPKIFQGLETCKETTNRIRTAISNALPFEETLINYRKNGTTYKCLIKGEPIFNTTGELVNFIAYEKQVA